MEINKIDELFSTLNISNWELAYELLSANKNERDVNNEVFFQIVTNYKSVSSLEEDVIRKFINSKMSNKYNLAWRPTVSVKRNVSGGINIADVSRVGSLIYETDNTTFKWRLDEK